MLWTLSSQANEMVLSENWQIQDSALVSATPDVISTVGFPTKNWIATTVPQTVLGALTSPQLISFDPFIAENLLLLPGSGSYYSPSQNFGTQVIPAQSPFGRPWYYRTEFTLPTSPAEPPFVDLQLLGATYGATVWLNGRQLPSTAQNKGTYRTPQFNITPYLREGANALAIAVGPSQPSDLTASWVDWNPTPQDKNMGLWQNVVLKIHGAVAIAHPQVTSQINGVGQDARLTVEAEVTNSSAENVTGVLNGKITTATGSIFFSKEVSIASGSTKLIQFVPSDFPQLIISHPDLWWPAQMGSPTLHSLELTFSQNQQVSDRATLAFGIREITSELTTNGSRLFKVNGKPIEIKGGGWSSDLFLRFSPDRVQKELRYVKDLGLNTIRLEGRFEPDYFLNQTDQAGLLVMTGWVCCNAWQDNKSWSEEQTQIATLSLRDQIYQFRSHPSVLAFLYGSDEAPPVNIEKVYLDTFKQFHWPNPVLSSAARTQTDLNGLSGFKMNGPYDYTPPSYWLADPSTYGGAWGFNTETSPGPSIPTLESLRKFIPADHLWPIDDEWLFHAGQLDFHSLSTFTNAMNLRYGKATSLQDFAFKAQAMGYDNHRAMFEAFARNKYHPATGVIQWMLNSSWPSLIWHLYDYYLSPAGAYFGVKKANQPLHLIYADTDQTVSIINQTQNNAENLTAVTDIFDFKMHGLFHNETKTRSIPDSSATVLTLPKPNFPTRTYFVKLSLKDLSGSIIDNNFYWLSTQKEIYDWPETNYVKTPVSQEGDLRELETLPLTEVELKSTIDLERKQGQIQITNSGHSLAFMIRLKLSYQSQANSAATQEVLPVIWEDNYISLIPGETRTVAVHFEDAPEIKTRPIEVSIEGWNLKK